MRTWALWPRKSNSHHSVKNLVREIGPDEIVLSVTGDWLHDQMILVVEKSVLDSLRSAVEKFKNEFESSAMDTYNIKKARDEMFALLSKL